MEDKETRQETKTKYTMDDLIYDIKKESYQRWMRMRYLERRLRWPILLPWEITGRGIPRGR